eukprot:2583529-Karenia_brevis.AAC.1
MEILWPQRGRGVRRGHGELLAAAWGSGVSVRRGNGDLVARALEGVCVEGMENYWPQRGVECALRKRRFSGCGAKALCVEGMEI